MKILITGAAGFIGSHTAEALAKEGHDVTGLDNFSPYYDPKIKEQTAAILKAAGIPVIKTDISKADWDLGFANDFEYIYHFAAQPGIAADATFEAYEQNNVVATKHLLSFALKNPSLKMLVNISTSSVYGIDADKDEETVPQPVSYYGVTKLAAEQLVLSYARAGKLKACSLRLYSVYGPRERPDKLYTKLIDAVINEKPFPFFKGSEKHIRSFTYVGDIVKGIIAVTGKEDVCNTAIINLGTDKENTTAAGVEIAEKILEKKVLLNILPPREGDQLRTKAVIDKAKRLLNYAPETTLEEGLREQVKWFKEKENF